MTALSDQKDAHIAAQAALELAGATLDSAETFVAHQSKFRDSDNSLARAKAGLSKARAELPYLVSVFTQAT